MAHIQWYPGHMAKAKKEVQSQLSAVDIVLEIRDARIPTASMNPMLDEIIKNKRHMIVLNKQDLADPQQTKEWVKALSGENKLAIALDSKKLGDMKIFRQALKDFTQDIQDKWRNKGILHKSIRVMVIGIPNVGKSTFINQFTKQKKAQVGNKPGVTKGQQWIKIDKDFELLDTPGILWPKFEDQEVADKLALTGGIKDTHFYKDDVALFALEFFLHHYRDAISNHYPINAEDVHPPYPDLLMALTKRMGMLEDYDRASDKIIRDYRDGKLGRMTLDRIEEYQISENIEVSD
ncbi:ribosome biogenesis GTPase YlqF [Aerococcus urinaeequi]|uniref:Ribosome biogenesis GTPase A n=1 Tax=Aerococcus urinaeequi TaxID=51665 RepID=A0AA47J2P8_9LACT|nr:ribosome biogenesis GTPase YlqF [Aerococcus urinaeequi]WAT23667.1 ribosome biogenesis GTPase YlqF [Aerococcus urinaeequi]